MFRCEIKEPSLKLLHEAGPPMYLGFLIHMFLHFLIMQTRIGRSRSHRSEELTAPLLYSQENTNVGIFINRNQ